MAKDNLTPEEKLLKIIENPDVPKRDMSLAGKMKSINAAPLKSWFGRLHLDKSILKRINLRLINKIMAVACLIITLAWIFNFTATGIGLAKRFKQVISGQEASRQEEKILAKVDVNIEEALTQIKRRNMFTLLPSKAEAQASVDIGLTLGNLKLVGILWSDNPQAMIENSKEQKTYFVTKGDKIGDIEVRNILRDKVVVGRGAEEWELR
ncbi:MAG: hypothetical protein Q8R38_02375 [Candidatus Omnitrophota bacterium]|nr:hypothetical protein [Candidatus Omnitrophota bacterium]